jgi:hypothetical protein
LQSVGDLYDLTVLFPQREESSHDNDAFQYAISSKSEILPLETGHQSAAGHQVLNDKGGRTRMYTPGHGIVGKSGFGGGDMLECSALIKLDKNSEKEKRSSSDAERLSISDKYQRAFWAGHATWRPYYAMLR